MVGLLMLVIVGGFVMIGMVVEFEVVEVVMLSMLQV